MTQKLTLPDRAAQSWRLWLLTGNRREHVDRRRLRGAHLGLKRVLVEDMLVRGEPAYCWKEFSDAMLRQAIGDAVRLLPERDGHVLKLAYFGGFSNQEIAAQIGMTEAAVAARLRHALDEISRQLRRGAATARRSAYAVAIWLGGRWCADWVHRAAEATSVAVVAVAVAFAGGAAVPGTGGVTSDGPSVGGGVAAPVVSVTAPRPHAVTDPAPPPGSAPPASGAAAVAAPVPQVAPAAVSAPLPLPPAAVSAPLPLPPAAPLPSAPGALPAVPARPPPALPPVKIPKVQA